MKYLKMNMEKLSPFALLSLAACGGEKTFSLYVPGTTSPIKILALHGGGGSSASFSSQAGMVSLMNNLPEVEFVFANAPSNVAEDGTGKDGKVWIQDSPSGKGELTTDLDWADDSIAYLDDLVSQEGPFFGILGYSQGAAFIPVYLANTSNTFNIAVMNNGYLPTTHQGLMNAINSVAPFEITSLIFSGENDYGFKDLAQGLADAFNNSLYIRSSVAGHHLPFESDPAFDLVLDFISTNLDTFAADYGMGTDGDDVLIGTTGDNVLDGGTGADTIYSRSGSDTIVLRLGDGGSALATADTIADFTDGTDKLGLDDNLQYGDLTISQGAGTNSSDTIISKGSEYLAILTGIDANVLSEADFISVDIA
jgi:predicted esterase